MGSKLEKGSIEDRVHLHVQANLDALAAYQSARETAATHPGAMKRQDDLNKMLREGPDRLDAAVSVLKEFTELRKSSRENSLEVLGSSVNCHQGFDIEGHY